LGNKPNGVCGHFLVDYQVQWQSVLQFRLILPIVMGSVCLILPRGRTVGASVQRRSRTIDFLVLDRNSILKESDRRMFPLPIWLPILLRLHG
jgi:hypothetical protein